MTFPWNQFSHSEERKRILRDAQFFSLCSSVHLHGRDLLHIHADSGYIVRLATQGEFLCGSVILLIDGDLGISIAGQKSLGGLVDQPVFQWTAFVEVETMGCIEYRCRVCGIGSQTANNATHRGMTMHTRKMLFF